MSQTHPAVSLAVTRVHVDRPLTILDCQVVVVHLAVSGRSVAVEHWVAPVQLNGLGVHLEGVDELLSSHQVVSLSLQSFCLLLVGCGGGRLLLQLRKKMDLKLSISIALPQSTWQKLVLPTSHSEKQPEFMKTPFEEIYATLSY